MRKLVLVVVTIMVLMSVWGMIPPVALASSVVQIEIGYSTTGDIQWPHVVVQGGKTLFYLWTFQADIDATWDFGDGQVQSVHTGDGWVIHVYQLPGNYLVKAYVRYNGVDYKIQKSVRVLRVASLDGVVLTSDQGQTSIGVQALTGNPKARAVWLTGPDYRWGSVIGYRGNTSSCAAAAFVNGKNLVSTGFLGEGDGEWYFWFGPMPLLPSSQIEFTVTSASGGWAQLKTGGMAILWDEMDIDVQPGDFGSVYNLHLLLPSNAVVSYQYDGMFGPKDWVPDKPGWTRISGVRGTCEIVVGIIPGKATYQLVGRWTIIPPPGVKDVSPQSIGLDDWPFK